jgi:MarR family transcriptional regulator for hemolysin
MHDIRDIWLYANHILWSSRQIINERLKPLHLSSAEGNILLHLLTRQQPLPQEAIVAQLDISKPAVSRALKSLQAKGFVHRQKDQNDKRASLVYLTEKAQKIAPQIEQVYNQVFSIASQGVSAEEINAFIQLFARVSENFTHFESGKGAAGRPS